MHRPIHFFLILLGITCGVLAQAPAPDQGGGGRGRGRGGDRGWWGGPPGWGGDNPEFSRRMVDRYLQRLTRQYELDETQQQQVRSRLQELQAQQEQYAAPLREESRALRDEMIQLRRDQDDGLGIDTQREEEVRTRLREMWRNSPLNQTNVTSEVEKLLPPDQVQKAQRQDRPRGFGGEGSQQDSWRRYVDRFCTRYQLDASQRATVEAVLRNLTEQKDRYRQAHKSEFDAVGQIQDRAERQEKLRQLNQPIQEQFGELRTKLDQIPTVAQKTMAQAASRPAESATSRPSIN